MTARQAIEPLAANALIEALKGRTGALSDQELAEALSVGKSTIASWRRRGSVPPKVIRSLTQRFGLSVEQLSADKREYDEKVEELQRVVLYTAIVFLIRERPDTPAHELARLLPVLVKAFRHSLDCLVRDHEDYQGVVGAAKMMIDIEQGKLTTEQLFDLAKDVSL